MKIVIINTYDITGGAAIATFRLVKALEKQNIDVKMLVQKKKTDFQIIEQTNNNFFNQQKKFFNFAFERLLFKFKERDPSVRFAFSMANIGEDISKHKLLRQADIIHLNWVNSGFLSLKSLKNIFKLGKPIVWTLHDMWAFTGGCHYAYECNNFIRQCGNCFYLKKPFAKDLSYKTWKRKTNLFANQALNIVSVSSWLSKNAKNSSLLKDKSHYVIANALNSVFKPVEKEIARKKLGIYRDKIVLLFGSDKIDNPTKGFKYFIESIKTLQKITKINSNDILICMFGTIKNNKEKILNQIPFEYKYFGFVKDKDELINIYSAASVTVVTSLYEAFGQVIAESMICKTPVVAFDNTGPTDIISHKKDGYLAKFQSSKDIANGINWLLFKANYEQICENAYNNMSQKFSGDEIANQYLNLYKKLKIQH